MNNIETMVTYSDITNPFNVVLIKSDDSFVIVGDINPTDEQLIAMTNWEEVEGFDAE